MLRRREVGKGARQRGGDVFGLGSCWASVGLIRGGEGRGGSAGVVWVRMVLGPGGRRWWWRRRAGPANLALLLQEWDRKAEDARRDYEKAMKEYSVGSKSESSKT